MKKNLFVTVAVLSLAVVLSSCGASYNTIKRMQKIEEGVSNPTTKEELIEAIRKFDKRSMDLALTDGQIGIWYKILGTRYLDQQEYGKALECFQKALTYYPANQNLYYYVGVCAGFLAPTYMDYNAEGINSDSVVKRMNYLHLAEDAYLQALSLDPKYYRAMYGLGVLYVFTLDECDKAIPHLEKFLETQKKDTNAMFVLARAYYVTGEGDKAVALYDRIIELKPNAAKVKEAEANKKKVLEVMSSRKN